MKFNLGGLKRLFGKRKKKGGDSDDLDDLLDLDENEDEGAREKPALAAPVAADADKADGEGAKGDFPDEMEQGGGRFSKLVSGIMGVVGTGRRRIAVLGGAGVVALLLLGGGGWLLFSGGDDELELADGGASRDGASVTLDLSEAARTQRGALTPQSVPGQSDQPGQPDPSGAAPTAGLMPAQPLRPGQVAEAGVVVAAVSPSAYAALADQRPAEPLAAAPIPELSETVSQRAVPRKAADGRQPWQVYARPFDPRDDRPRIAVIITGLGLSAAETEAAVAKLPPEVTLAFSPYGRTLEKSVAEARAAGHEVLMTLPMEPQNYPISDPGRLGLMTALSNQDNAVRLYSVMGRAAGYVGLISDMGTQFAASEAHLGPILATLNERGLMVVDATMDGGSKIPALAATIGVPRAFANVRLDDDPDPEAIRWQLANLETTVRSTAFAVALARPYPSTIAAITAWAATLGPKNLALAPVSALANRQMVP